MMNRLYFRHKSSNKSRSSVSSLEENNEEIGDVPDQKNDKWNDLRRTKSLMEKPPRQCGDAYVADGSS